MSEKHFNQTRGLYQNSNLSFEWSDTYYMKDKGMQDKTASRYWSILHLQFYTVA